MLSGSASSEREPLLIAARVMKSSADGLEFRKRVLVGRITAGPAFGCVCAFVVICANPLLGNNVSRFRGYLLNLMRLRMALICAVGAVSCAVGNAYCASGFFGGFGVRALPAINAICC
jgi:hypothetical protein